VEGGGKKETKQNTQVTGGEGGKTREEKIGMQKRLTPVKKD